MNPAPSVRSAMSVAASWSTILVAAAFVNLPSRNPLMISQSVAVDHDVVATGRTGASPLIDDRRAAMHARPGEDRGLAVVACDPAAEFGLVASDEFDDLDPGQASTSLNHSSHSPRDVPGCPKQPDLIPRDASDLTSYLVYPVPCLVVLLADHR
jgi:hypothetical protein